MFSFKAIAIKQRKPFLNRDDGLDLLVIYSPLWEYVPNFPLQTKTHFTLANEVRVIPTKYSSHFKTFLL